MRSLEDRRKSAFGDRSNLHRDQAVDMEHPKPKYSGGTGAIVSSAVHPVPASTGALSSSCPGVEKMNHFEETLRHLRNEMSAIKDETVKQVQSLVQACVLNTVGSKSMLERLADATAVEEREDNIHSKGIGSRIVARMHRNENTCVLESGLDDTHSEYSGGYDHLDHAAESGVSARLDYCLMARNQSVESDSSEDTDSQEEKGEMLELILDRLKEDHHNTAQLRSHP